ncbi:MAG: hypothetical protein ACNA8W_09750 [Bradymonadaceae bacterium]
MWILHKRWLQAKGWVLAPGWEELSWLEEELLVMAAEEQGVQEFWFISCSNERELRVLTAPVTFEGLRCLRYEAWYCPAFITTRKEDFLLFQFYSDVFFLAGCRHFVEEAMGCSLETHWWRRFILDTHEELIDDWDVAFRIRPYQELSKIDWEILENKPTSRKTLERYWQEKKCLDAVNTEAQLISSDSFVSLEHIQEREWIIVPIPGRFGSNEFNWAWCADRMRKTFEAYNMGAAQIFEIKNDGLNPDVCWSVPITEEGFLTFQWKCEENTYLLVSDDQEFVVFGSKANFFLVAGPSERVCHFLGASRDVWARLFRYFSEVELRDPVSSEPGILKEAARRYLGE